MFQTFELGPTLNSSAFQFSLPDHNNIETHLSDLMGQNGLLLGFIGDIWQPTSVRRILWLQRHVRKLAAIGTPVALLVRDHPATLYGFHSSSPLPVPFPMLADASGQVHMQYRLDRHPGLLFLDPHYMIRQKWLMPDDRVWPKLHELVDAIQQGAYA